jgi:hypothetical protein
MCIRLGEETKPRQGQGQARAFEQGMKTYNRFQKWSGRLKEFFAKSKFILFTRGGKSFGGLTTTSISKRVVWTRLNSRPSDNTIYSFIIRCIEVLVRARVQAHHARPGRVVFIKISLESSRRSVESRTQSRVSLESRDVNSIGTDSRMVPADPSLSLERDCRMVEV